MSADPIGFESGDVNLYRYVRNNPIALFDPVGLIRTDIAVVGNLIIYDGELGPPSWDDIAHLLMFGGGADPALGEENLNNYFFVPIQDRPFASDITGLQAHIKSYAQAVFAEFQSVVLPIYDQLVSDVKAIMCGWAIEAQSKGSFSRQGRWKLYDKGHGRIEAGFSGEATLGKSCAVAVNGAAFLTGRLKFSPVPLLAFARPVVGITLTGKVGLKTSSETDAQWTGSFQFTPFGGLRWEVPKVFRGSLKEAFGEVGLYGSAEYDFRTRTWQRGGGVYGRGVYSTETYGQGTHRRQFKFTWGVGAEGADLF